MGVIGAYSSDLSKVVADFLRVFEIPQISYGSSASVLSDKTIYSYLFRTIPPDTQQANAMAAICKKLGWTYVITVHSNGLYGEKGMEDFRAAAKSHQICIAKPLKLRAFPSDGEYDELVLELNEESRAHAVVMFVDIRDTRGIFKALSRSTITKQFYWVGSDGWGNNLNAVESFESYAEGAITITQLDTPVEGFKEYFENLNVSGPSNRNNTWLKEFWQSHFRCDLPGLTRHFGKNCSGNETLTSTPFPLAPVQTVVNAVYAIAYALHNYTEGNCQNYTEGKRHHGRLQPINRESLRGCLVNLTFTSQGNGEQVKFDKYQELLRNHSIHTFRKYNGSYMYMRVGSYGTDGLDLDLSRLIWTEHNESVCSDTCPNGHYRKRKGNHDIQCCWSCEPCKEREIVDDMNNTCLECPFGKVPNANQSRCMDLPVVDAMSDGAAKALLTISVVGLVFVIITATIFFRHGNVPLIKASSRELSGIILLGLALLFIFPWVLFAKPTSSMCISQPLIMGVALSSCYAPLFMKILRIYRIFKTARKSAGKPILISPASQVLIAVGLITIQLLFSLISFFPTPPEPVTREIDDVQSLFLECSMGKDVFATLLSYNMFLMVLCTVMAFKTRKFPRNFNEAKYIGFTMYFTCFVWIIFFPSYLSRGSGLGRIIWESSAVVLVGWITLIGLFGPKICHLVLGDHLSSTTDQLAVTSNTVSQAAVVSTCTSPGYITESSGHVQFKHGDVKENSKTEMNNEQKRKGETTSC